MQHDAMMMVRSDIVARIDGIAAGHTHISLLRICDEVDQIRHIARRFGLEPVERLASMLETALALDGHGPVVLSYLDLMRDAAGCEDAGPEATAAFAGMLSLRLGA